MKNKIIVFAALVEAETITHLKQAGVSCEANLKNAKTSIKEGSKYTKVDIGTSGRYMVEMSTGNIFGIKGYGTIHRGHFYGTVDTTADYFWGGYYPERKSSPLPKQKWTIPALTFAPAPGSEAMIQA